MPLPTPEQERAAILALLALGILAVIGAGAFAGAVVIAAIAIAEWVFA